MAFIQAPVDAVFAFLDDFRRLSAHMEKPSGMTMGMAMEIVIDAQEGRAVGSRVRMCGRVLGVDLHLEEVVTERQPPLRKAWRTQRTRLFVIGDYRLGFELAPAGARTTARIFIDYDEPAGVARLLSRVLGPTYARWCVRRMAQDAARHFTAR